MKNKMNIVYILSHPIQYISPLLKEMAKEFNLNVYYFSDTNVKGNIDKEFGKLIAWDVPLLEGYTYTFIRNWSPWSGVSNRFFELINPGLIKCLRKDPSSIIIVNGWGYFSSILAIIAGRLLGKKVWLRGENPLSQEIVKGKKLLFIKKILLKHFLFRFVYKFLYIGKENKGFFEYYGANANQLVYTPYCVDNFFFSTRYNDLRRDVPSLRSKLALPVNKLVILFAGKYIQKKRPMDIIKAFQILNDPQLALVMVGEGELRNEMEAYISANNLTNIFLTGFINQSKIAEYYTVSDIFVMCSGVGETWGLSVNEAMNFAKPVIVTNTCGCSVDLVEHGKNGFVVEEGNIEQLSGAISKLVNNKPFRMEAGERSKQKIADYSIDVIIENLKIALR